jgi:DNA-binding IclR family transcriptional regulator
VAEPATAGREAREGSQTLERGLAVLLALGAADHGLTASEVAVACGLHRSIAYRLLVSLVRTGFAVRDASGRYRPGPAATSLADRVRPRVRAVAEPVLHRLAARLDATASLVEVVGDAAVATVVAEPPTDGPRFSYRLGARDPLDRGAGGIAAQASGPPAAGEDDRVRAAREAGFVTTSAELNPGAHALAAPVPGAGVLAAVNVVTNRPELLASAVDEVVAAARDIAAAMS